jgi:hypothetical protein
LKLIDEASNMQMDLGFRFIADLSICRSVAISYDEAACKECQPEKGIQAFSGHPHSFWQSMMSQIHPSMSISVPVAKRFNYKDKPFTSQGIVRPRQADPQFAFLPAAIIRALQGLSGSHHLYIRAGLTVPGDFQDRSAPVRSNEAQSGKVRVRNRHSQLP